MSSEEMQSAIAASQSMLLNELREMRSAQMEEHARVKHLENKVEADLDAVQGVMSGMMGKVMDVIEMRLQNNSAAMRSASSSSPGREQNPFASEPGKDHYSFSASEESLRDRKADR